MPAAQNNQPLGNKLKRLLQEKHISKAAFSERAHIEPSQLTRLLNGQRRFERPALVASAKALAMSPEDLARGTREAALLPTRKGARTRSRTRGSLRTGNGNGNGNGNHGRTHEADRSAAHTPLRFDRASELQTSLAEQMELRAANHALAQRIAALESELSTARKQIELLRTSGPGTRIGKPMHGPTRKPGRVFGAALFASLIGLGLRARRR